MSIFSATKWTDWYVLFASDSGTEIDEDGFYPEPTYTIFVNSKTGKLLDRYGGTWITQDFGEVGHTISSKAFTEVPFDNLKI